MPAGWHFAVHSRSMHQTACQHSLSPPGTQHFEPPQALLEGPRCTRGGVDRRPGKRCRSSSVHAGWGGTGSFLVLNSLRLGDNGLQGTLPETWGSNLNNVTTLDLSQNLLSGTLPAGGLHSLAPEP